MKKKDQRQHQTPKAANRPRGLEVWGDIFLLLNQGLFKTNP